LPVGPRVVLHEEGDELFRGHQASPHYQFGGGQHDLEVVGVAGFPCRETLGKEHRDHCTK
jgi:hypothetical protein